MITIELQGRTADDRSWTRYRIAGVDVAVDLPLPHLAPFQVREEGEAAVAARTRVDPGEAPDVELVFEGAGAFGGGLHHVRCEAAGGAYRLTVGAGERFVIGPSGIVRLASPALECGPSGAAPEDDVVHAVLGPCLALALARRGIFCLHASAVRCGDGAALFSGASGAGKSTLADFLHGDPHTAWERISDDITPVTGGVDGPTVLPRFPQLALHPARPPFTDESLLALEPVAPEQLALRTLYLIADRDGDRRPEAGAGAGAGRVSLTRLTATRAAAAVVQSTIALPLLARDELAALLELASTIATGTPITRLEFARGLEHLPAVAEVLRADLADVEGAGAG